MFFRFAAMEIFYCITLVVFFHLNTRVGGWLDYFDELNPNRK